MKRFFYLNTKSETLFKLIFTDNLVVYVSDEEDYPNIGNMGEFERKVFADSYSFERFIESQANHYNYQGFKEIPFKDYHSCFIFKSSIIENKSDFNLYQLYNKLSNELLFNGVGYTKQASKIVGAQKTFFYMLINGYDLKNISSIIADAVKGFSSFLIDIILIKILDENNLSFIVDEEEVVANKTIEYDHTVVKIFRHDIYYCTLIDNENNSLDVYDIEESSFSKRVKLVIDNYYGIITQFI